MKLNIPNNGNMFFMALDHALEQFKAGPNDFSALMVLTMAKEAFDCGGHISRKDFAKYLNMVAGWFNTD